ncbi:glycosyltransferase family protein [Psychrobacter alimentarius]|uniref:hypothetical protein n=1 Tax=Psychrobacter alimentarius TaxID=261164 RepID=UPI00191A2078|nr:hypothetical protein [Psychrobacter alimentarius]
MLIEEINFDSIVHLIKGKHQAPIVRDFSEYFSGFNLKRVLLVTDEDIETDIRVLNQLTALRKKTENITILRVMPNNNYTSIQKNKILKSLYLEALKKILYFPWFVILVMIHHPRLKFRTKAKQGIYNDHSYFLSEKIDTSCYTCVICNNLISASIVDSHDQVEYIYDIHELEVFRNRNKASIQRSFYIYLKEMKELRRKKNIITISKHIAKTLSKMYGYKIDKIHCIYNRNFNHPIALFNESTHEKKYLLIYVGSVSLDRGLEDIVRLSFEYDILVIACNYKEKAVNYLEENSNLNRLKIFKGMDYQVILSESIQQYQYPLFLILINPNYPSYRYALPNKFFQSQAIGCPIIAYEKTYLADIILEFKCGLIFSDNTDINFLNNIDEEIYVSMKTSMEIDIEEAINCKRL